MKRTICPICKNSDLNYTPWLGQLWKCNNCGYRGTVVVEEDRNVDRKIQTKKNKRNS